MAHVANNSDSSSAQQAKSVRIWFPIYIGDFFAVTSCMTGHEVGAYQLILAKIWKDGGSIPANDRQLAKLVKATTREWREIKETLWPLFEVKGGFLSHAQTTAEIKKAEALAEKKRAAAVKRWAGNSDASGMHVHSACNADGMPRACEGEGDCPSQGKLTRDSIEDLAFRVVDGGQS